MLNIDMSSTTIQFILFHVLNLCLADVILLKVLISVTYTNVCVSMFEVFNKLYYLEFKSFF